MTNPDLDKKCFGSYQLYKCTNCDHKTQKIKNCNCSSEQEQWTAHRTNAGYHYHICENCVIKS